ncbi:hypothetical protein JJB07_05360 [Tumebacillus sp. ITR2]|uniref:Uncharacterized protein n=1 Tax=Tumebacillus amylolyticus TaxID=2801339 RepID=A0ABS1J725_9BACL|nr:hypothetical protein [Tumebacillus amylolyticus]MBL0386076.1 hypothetical protein [Tumebacillus amylolyticus]
MPQVNFQIGACYGLSVAGQTMGSFRVFNGKVVAEDINSVTIKYMGQNTKVTRRTIRRSDIMKAVKL